MKRPFKSQPEGVRVQLPEGDLVFLRSLPELLEGVDSVTGDPAYVRLHVAAYPHDATAQDELEQVTGPDLDATRRADRESFLASLTKVQSGQTGLSMGEAEVWLRILGDSRLALAARLGIEEPGWENAGDGGDPAQAALGFLSYLQSELVDALMGSL